MIVDTQFQTPPVVAEYMATLIANGGGSILEPTPGIGNLVAAITGRGNVVAPNMFEDIAKGSRYDQAVMNPPFTPMVEGFRYLREVMEMTDHIVALLPWFIIINSERRLRVIQEFGLVKVISIPRKTFPGARIQCCILVMQKGYVGETVFSSFNW